MANFFMGVVAGTCLGILIMCALALTDSSLHDTGGDDA